MVAGGSHDYGARARSLGEDLSDLRRAAGAIPGPVSGALWEGALVSILRNLGGGPAWQRCQVRPGADGVVAVMLRSHPGLFTRPLVFARAHRLAGASWRDTIVVARPVAPPESAARLAGSGLGAWYAPGLGLDAGGTTGLLLASVFTTGIPGYELDKAGFRLLHRAEGAMSDGGLRKSAYQPRGRPAEDPLGALARAVAKAA